MRGGYMMKKYLINKLDEERLNIIITLLDFEIKISDYLKSINISDFNGSKLLVDTALCSGMNRYRFIETTVNDNGAINLNDYKYVEVDSNILDKANEILSHEESIINNSILTIPQIKLLTKGYSNNKE